MPTGTKLCLLALMSSPKFFFCVTTGDNRKCKQTTPKPQMALPTGNGFQCSHITQKIITHAQPQLIEITFGYRAP